jgi:hypothetical protein
VDPVDFRLISRRVDSQESGVRRLRLAREAHVGSGLIGQSRERRTAPPIRRGPAPERARVVQSGEEHQRTVPLPGRLDRRSDSSHFASSGDGLTACRRSPTPVSPAYGTKRSSTPASPRPTGPKGPQHPFRPGVRDQKVLNTRFTQAYGTKRSSTPVSPRRTGPKRSSTPVSPRRTGPKRSSTPVSPRRTGPKRSSTPVSPRRPGPKRSSTPVSPRPTGPEGPLRRLRRPRRTSWPSSRAHPRLHAACPASSRRTRAPSGHGLGARARGTGTGLELPTASLRRHHCRVLHRTAPDSS